MSINWKDFILRSIASIVGIVFIGFGAALSETMDMGLDPFTALNRGASDLLGFSLGNYQLVINLIILLIMFFVKRDLIGWGTIYNMVLVGYLVDFFNNMFGNFFQVDQMSFMIRILITIVAILIFTLGVAIYMDVDLGISPYDAISPMITDKTGWRFAPTRVGQDLVVVIGAFLLGGPVGISTVITGFFAGPLIEFFSNKIGQPLDDKIEEVA